MTRSPTPAVRTASEPRYKGSWTDSDATVTPTATMAKIQRLARTSKLTDTGPQSIRYGEKAAVTNTTSWVIGKYRAAKAQPAIAHAMRPVAVSGARRILDISRSRTLATLRMHKSAAFFRVRRRAGFVKPKRSFVEPVRTRRRHSVFLNVFKLNVHHVMPCGLQGRAVESHPMTLVER
jgi:hypothetical protein